MPRWALENICTSRFPPRRILRRPSNEFSSPSTLSGSAIYLLQSHSRQECRTSTVGLEDADVQQRRLRARRAACNATRRVNIGRGAGKKVSGSRTMDLFVVVIIAAMLLTVGTVFLGVLTMSAGGSTDNHFSTPLMW